MVTPQCKKLAEVDEPDGEFIDANCDGIDGDKLKGIFVSPAGVDTAAGTMSAPVKTIGKGVLLAIAAKKDVYVCQGDYAENLLLEGDINLRLFGGYACADWKRSNQRPLLKPKAGVPLRIKDNLKEIVVDRLEVQAPDATTASGSSISAWISNSKRVTLRQVQLQAGAGAPGENGVGSQAVLAPPPKAPDGESRPDVSCSCATTDALCFVALGFTFASESCVTPTGPQTLYTGQGGDGANLKSCYLGSSLAGGMGSPGLADDGANGQPGTDGMAGVGIGAFTGTEGYVANNAGTPGALGMPGKSGRGGTGGPSGVLLSASNGFPDAWFRGGRGGYGGLPGCGGFASSNGSAGGASIALLSWESKVVLEFSNILTHDGGMGGDGAPGAPGQPGGQPGAGGFYGALAGQKGGNGGKGGDGGPGGGGPALGIVAVGVAPDLQSVLYGIGKGGLGGKSVPNSVVPDAAAGVAADYWPVDIRPEVNGSAGAAGMAGKGGT